jgi:peptidoglycan/LPS O-acetylase OafA/YrhL
MFGIYRYGLAFCVAISHLWAGMVIGPAAFAVWGFYCLSGYLMALILNEKYGFSPKGVATFAANRFLRIYPAYYVVCALMLVLFLLIPAQAQHFLPQLQKPFNMKGWLFALTLMSPLGGGELLHGAAALRIELWFYVLMALGLARGKWVAIPWFLGSCGFTIWQLYWGFSFPDRYVGVRACSIAFSSGVLVYHYRDAFPVFRTPWPAVGAACLWWLHVWAATKMRGGSLYYGLYTSLIFSAIAMITLIRLEPKKMPTWLARLDRLAGNLSYPIYLCHWGVAVIVTAVFPGLSRTSFWTFVICFPLVNLLAYAIYTYVEGPLQSWKLESGKRRPIVAAVAAGGFRVDAASDPSPVALGAASAVRRPS